MSENKATTKTAIAYKSGFESGYEKGVRDMWEEMTCNCRFGNATNEQGKACKPDDNCNINNCPIAKKLLKAVK